jgi:hypothetical protein
MTYHIFIDESRRRDWFVVAGILVRDAGLGPADAEFLRALHAHDDRKEGDTAYRDKLRRVVEILAPRRAVVLYSVTNLAHPVRSSPSIPLQFAGIKSVLTPLLPFFGVCPWRVVIEQFSGGYEAAVEREGERANNRLRRARAQAVEQYVQGEATSLLESLYGLGRDVDMTLSFAGWQNEPWLGAADYMAYSISDHWNAEGAESDRLREQFGALELFRVDV